MRAVLDLTPFNTERLRLRRLELADADAFRAMTDEPTIIEAVHFLAPPFTRVDAERLTRGEDGKDCFWGTWLSSRTELVARSRRI